MRGEIVSEEQIELARLVHDAGDDGDEKPEAEGRRQFHSAALRMASHSRSACASRGETSGYSGSAPILVRIFQERAHLRPSARFGFTATPGTSGRRKPSAGPSSRAQVAGTEIHAS